MDSTPEREDRQPRGPWSRWRRWGILLGGLILLAVVFDLLERIVGPDEPPAAEIASDPATTLEPIRPDVTKVGRTGVRVEVEGGNRITLNLDDEVKADRAIACLVEGIATSPAFTEGEAGQPPTSGFAFARRTRANQVWREVIRIHNHCTTNLALNPPAERP